MATNLTLPDQTALNNAVTAWNANKNYATQAALVQAHAEYEVALRAAVLAATTNLI